MNKYELKCLDLKVKLVDRQTVFFFLKGSATQRMNGAYLK